MMTAAIRKAAFRKLSSGHDLDDLARLLGYPPSTLRTWLNPSHPRAPSEEAIARLRKAAIADRSASAASVLRSFLAETQAGNETATSPLDASP